jgi:hypothetical protein
LHFILKRLLENWSTSIIKIIKIIIIIMITIIKIIMIIIIKITMVTIIIIIILIIIIIIIMIIIICIYHNFLYMNKSKYIYHLIAISHFILRRLLENWSALAIASVENTQGLNNNDDDDVYLEKLQIRGVLKNLSSTCET